MDAFLFIVILLFLRGNSKYIDEDNPYTCHENCETCLGPIIDENNMNCETCKENYFKTEDTNSCYSLIPDNYYLDDENILRRCHLNCKSCLGRPTDDDMNCLTCFENYIIQLGTNNCILLTDDSNKIKSLLERDYTWFFGIFVAILILASVISLLITIMPKKIENNI